jgi:hypothetical protein
MAGIIIQIQASITSEAKDNLGEYEKMQQKSKKIQIYKIKHNSPSNQVMGLKNTKFLTQEGSNQNSRFLNGKRPYSP